MSRSGRQARRKAITPRPAYTRQSAHPFYRQGYARVPSGLDLPVDRGFQSGAELPLLVDALASVVTQTRPKATTSGP